MITSPDEGMTRTVIESDPAAPADADAGDPPMELTHGRGSVSTSGSGRGAIA
jgi:hypothetical protein